MNYISSNLDRDLSLEEIARQASFSPIHFHRIFKAVVGETVAAFIRRLRMQRAACQLITKQELDITTIALDCGFSSSQNFSRAFRQYFEMTPTEFKKSKIGNMDRKQRNDLFLSPGYSPDPLSEPINLRKGSMEMKAEVKEMIEYNVAYARKMGPCGQKICDQAFNELMFWAEPRGYMDGRPIIAVFWDNHEVTPAEKCRVDACIPVPEGTLTEGAIGVQKLRGGRYVVCRFELDTSEFHDAWDQAFNWLMDKGYECAEHPSYELYHNDASTHPENKWIVDICIPLK